MRESNLFNRYVVEWLKIFCVLLLLMAATTVIAFFIGSLLRGGL